MKTYERMLSSLGVVALMVMTLSFSTAAYAIAGKFQFVNGEVLVIDTTGAQHAVKKGDTINEGDIVAASSTGFAQIKMEDGGFFAVRPDTRFKIDTFKFSGKDDGSEKGIFSLIKGSLRSVTGLIGKKHRDNYKIQTATSTIGIRGSGADVGHDDAVGTAVRTLFGGHSLTSNGKTVETSPGQTALAQPGQEPKLVPNFPFSTSNGQENGAGDSNKAAGNKSEKNNDQASNKSTTDSKKVEDKEVFIPVLTNEGINLTENTDQNGNAIGTGVTLPEGHYIHHVSSIVPQTSGYRVIEANNRGFFDSTSNFTFDADTNLTGIADTEFEESNVSGQQFSYSSASVTTSGGTFADQYHTADGSIYIGRRSGFSATACVPVCTPRNVISEHWIVALVPDTALVQTMTGSVSYNLAGYTHPTDAIGNVGTLNSASLNANFTTQTASVGVDLTVSGNHIVASGSSPITNGGFETKTSNGSLTITTCSTMCNGNIGGGFFGSTGATAAIGYDFWPTGGGNFTDYIHGLATFTGTTPSLIFSTAAALGSGVGTVALFSAGDPSSALAPLNEFNINDGVHFGSRNDGYGALLSFSRAGNGSGTEISFGRGSAVLADTGVASTAAYTVVWGRWDGSYIANSHTNGVTYQNSPSGTGNLHFIQSSQITTNLSPAVLGVTTAVYNGTSGTVPTTESGALGSTSILNASIAVNFSSQQITSYNLTTGGNGLGAWSVSGSGTIANFQGINGIPVSGGCSGAASGSSMCYSTGSPISGKASGAFVGSQAQGLISTYSLATSGPEKLVGTVYTQR